jgi:hypothetical protein
VVYKQVSWGAIPRRDGHRVNLKSKRNQPLKEDHGDSIYHYRRVRLAKQVPRG